MNQPPPHGASWPPAGSPDWPATPPLPSPPPATRRGPARGWYGAALGLLGLALLICCVGGLVGTRVVPDPLATARIGEALTVTMGAEEEFAVVVKLDATMPQDTGAEMVTCEVSGAGSSRTSWSQWEWLFTTGDGDWRVDHHIMVPGVQTSSYEVTCKARDPHVTDFGITKAPASVRSYVGLGAMICCPCLLLPAAAITALIVRTKRRRNPPPTS